MLLAPVGCAPDVPSDPTADTGGAGVSGGTGGLDQTSGAPGGGGGASGGTGGSAGDSGGASGPGGRATGGTGGGGGSAGTATAGTATGGAAGGASGPSCPVGAFLCEGVETQMVGAAPGAPWVPDTLGNGKITIDTSKSFSGHNSVHVTGTLTNGFKGDRANIATPMAIDSKTVWVRFMMYTASYPGSSGVHTRLMRLGTAAEAALGSPESSYSFATYNGTAIEKVNTVLQRSAGTKLNDSANKNRWICWEFEIDKTGGVGKVVPHIWLDMKELSLSPAGGSSHGGTSPSWDPINIEIFIMGLEGYQVDPIPADLWIDDVIINSQRVGCPAPR